MDVRATRKALGNRDAGDASTESADASPAPSIDQRALLETFCSKSPRRLVAAR